MSNENIVQAWKDEEYRAALTEEQIEQLPENPAGDTEISDEQLEDVDGGSDTAVVCCVTAIVSAVTAVSLLTVEIVREA